MDTVLFCFVCLFFVFGLFLFFFPYRSRGGLATKFTIMIVYHDYTPIAFDERVIFWLQRAGSLPCACAFAALHACAIA